MTQISATNAAAAGFRLARERPMVILIWAALQLATSIVMAFVMVSMGGAAMTEMMNMAYAPPGTTDPQAMFALYAQLAPLYGVMLLMSLVFYSVMLPAAYRTVLRPADSAFGYVRFGADEIRQLVVNVVLGIVLMVVYFGAAILMGLVVGIAAIGGQIVAAVGVVVGVIAAIGLFSSVAVRLSLAGPQTLAERRIRLFDSWRLTKGHFWPMLGTYVLAFLLAVVVTLLGAVIVFAASAVVGGGMDGLRGLMRPDMSSMGVYFTPLMIIYLVLMSVVSALGLAITLCAPAEIYRDLAGGASTAA